MKKEIRVVHCKKEPYDIYIGRPSKWGNPYSIGKDGTREEVLKKYQKWLKKNYSLMQSLHELRGKTLGCWCHPKPCHGNILKELVEKENMGENNILKPNNFCHLHLHTEYSQLDGMGKINDYVNRAVELGFNHLGITDHGNIDGLIKFQKACNEVDISPVLGCELYIVKNHKEKSKGRQHICVWIKNRRGFKNLCQMLTIANNEGFYYKPRIDPDILLNHCKGLIISTACMQSFLLADYGDELFSSLYDSIGDDLYVELMPHNVDKQVKLNKLCLRRARRFDLGTIITNDCHYVNQVDYKSHEVLLAIQRGAKWNDPKRWKFSMQNLHLRTAGQMQRAFERRDFYKDDYAFNTIEIAEKCSDFRIKQQRVRLPRVSGVKKGKEDRILKELCFSRYMDLFPEHRHIKENKIYYDRFKTEYDLIKEKNFIRYFLIVYLLIEWCKENNILVGPGRGSVGGSLIAYLLGITTVDPIKHNLLFSRFINEDRIDLPDIDIDFENTKVDMVKKYLEDTYGVDKIAGVSTFNRLKSRQVIKDVSRVFEVPIKEVDAFNKYIDPSVPEDSIENVIEDYDECARFADKYPEVIRHAKKLEGIVKTYGQHAAALVVSRDPIGKSGRCNLLERDGVSLINWEKDDTEYVGLMKLDILGLRLISILSEIRRLIKENHDKKIDFQSISLEDKKTLKDINNGETVGVFQLNTWAMTSLIKEMGIKKFDDIAAATALVRPGPYSSGMTAEYIKRKNGKEWDDHKAIKEIAGNTYGLIIYQEQVMDVIHKIAGLPYSTADKIRKVIGKKRKPKEFAPYKKQFIDGCSDVGIFSRKEAKEFWRGLIGWAKYGFNRSHAVEYAILGYWCSWLKKYYATEFICASLTYGAKTKKKELVEEAYRLGLTLLLPKIGISKSHEWVAKDKKIWVPFIEIKGIGPTKAIEAANMKIKKESRKGNVIFKKRENQAKIPKDASAFHKLLDSVGSFDSNDNTVSKSARKLFDFRVITEPKKDYEKLFKLFDWDIDPTRIKDYLEGNQKLLKTMVSPPIEERRFKGHKHLSRCNECELREECDSPVPPTPGKYNVMIIGEAPGPQEDRHGRGFYEEAPAGEKLWLYLKKRGYDREFFHITNVGKCYPSESGKPNPKQVEICGDLYLKKEIKRLKPKLILAFGNTCRQFFEGVNKGITGISGKKTWNEEYGAWICWCLHPAATKHNPENETYFLAGMRTFIKTLRTFEKMI